MSVADVNARASLVALALELDAAHAFLQQGDPSLCAELTRLADLGHRTVHVLGVSRGPLAPAHSWLRRIAAHWWRQQPDPRPDVQVAGRLVGSLDPDEARTALQDCRSITGAEPGLTSAAWEEVTSHRHQVLVCRGPRCTATGGEDSLRGLMIGMLEEGLGDDDVLLVHTGCQFPCNQAPVVSVQPDDVWYGHVDSETAYRIAREHLAGGRPVASHRLPRDRS